MVTTRNEAPTNDGEDNATAATIRDLAAFVAELRQQNQTLQQQVLTMNRDRS
ncbi:lysine decarboxylase [Sesbania bispinosa]|nr:lysine decarboxylase [Sesbania bispinosa]